MLVLDVRDQLGRLSTSSSDNVQWVLSQAETEVMALEIAARDARDSGTLSRVRIRYDVFYSRIDTLVSSPLYAGLNSNPDFDEGLSRLDTFRQSWIPLIDGPDSDLAAALPRLITEADEMRTVSRRMALAGIEVFAQQRDIRRESVSDTLLRIAVLTVALVFLLLVMVSALTRLARVRANQADENRTTRERMETIISTSLDAVVVTSADGRIIEYNGAAERVFGHPRAEAIGADMADLMMPDHMRKAHDEGMKRYNKSGEARVIGKGIVQLEAKRQNGEVFPIDLSLARAQSDEGEIFIAFMRDISRRVADETAMREARDRAIEGEKSKAELLAVMSHEMRTPLNGMLGTLDLIDTDTMDAKHRRYMRIIRNSGTVLLGHVNDVLDISRLDSGKFSLSKTRFDLIHLLEEVIETLQTRAAEHDNRLILAPVHPDFHEVYSDPGRLRQILLNLVGNTVKFTRNGKVVIEVDGALGDDHAEIRVIDNGTGVAEADLQRIFDDFVTVDTSYKRSNSGTGLGLGISRRLAVALGGELGAESELGDGSIFYVRLPLAPPAYATPEREAAESAAPDLPDDDAKGGIPNLNVLVVEDNAINRMIVREMLERDGHSVHEAHDGNEGIALAARNSYDIILMDISIPGCDGVTATQAIRASGVPGSTDIPIIATTAHALPDEVWKFHEAGMDDVLIKPMSITALRQLLVKTLGLSRTVTAPTQTDDDDSDGLIDWTTLHALRRDLPQAKLAPALQTLFAEIRAFLDTMPGQYGSAEDRRAMGAEAHRLAGSTGVFGLVAMTELMRIVQSQAPDAEPEDLQDILEALTDCWHDTCAALKADPDMRLSTTAALE